MSFRPRRALIAATAFALLPMPAIAQQFSDSYQFLEAIRKADGDKVTNFLNKPGTLIINTKDRETGDTALHIVARRGDITYLRFLLSKGANANATNRAGETPMLVATNQGFNEGVAVLLQVKANPNLGNTSGETPLIRAVQLRNIDLVRTLLAEGADPDKPDLLAGMSARDYARTDGRVPPAITKMLAEAPKRERKAVAGPGL